MGSIWANNTNFKHFDSLNNDLDTDVLIIGGGMTGLLCAYLLHKRGIEYALIEANRIAGGITQNTTAKITSQHNIIYSEVIKYYGFEGARQYADANENARRMYEHIIQENNIACDFETVPAYLYAMNKVNDLENEYSAMNKLGMDVMLTEETKLPFQISLALRLENQAQFNPLLFLSEISKELNIYEYTRAKKIDGNVVETQNGRIKANKIIIATHFPFQNVPGYYFLRMHQERSYVVALEQAQNDLDGVYLGVDGGKYSFRRHNNRILLGGEGHRTGKNKSGGSYSRLLKSAERFYPKSNLVCRWSAQDCMTHDSLPFIGRFSSVMENIYVATGYNKWGMSSSMVAAMLLSDEIAGEQKSKTIFSPRRHNLLKSAKGLAVDGFQSASGLTKQLLHFPFKSSEDIPPGHGGIVNYNGKKRGIYVTQNNDIYSISTRCPHLGCELCWNPDEYSWDCPCHGSRFDYKGNIINNPAQENANKKD